MTCKNCGTSVQGMGFCPNCGRKIEISQDPQPSPAVEPPPQSVQSPTALAPQPPVTPQTPQGTLGQPAGVASGPAPNSGAPQSNRSNRGLLISLIVVGSLIAASGVAFTALSFFPELLPGFPDSEQTEQVQPGEYGFDPALDTLWDECESGKFGSCDELYFVSREGSEYEEFGASCGGRSDAPGLCETIGGTEGAGARPGDDPELDLLWNECADGNFQACDDLFLASEAGSDYENFGVTCGDRGDPVGDCVARSQ